MLEWMAEVARGYGARTMLLEVRPSNASAVRMYERYGFQTDRRAARLLPGREAAAKTRL